MRKKNLVLFTTVVTALAVTSACGKKDDSSSSSALTSLAAVPNTTDGVGASAALEAALDGVGGSAASHASSTTGSSVKGSGSATWSGKSKAFCEMSRVLRDMYKETAQADRMKCMVGIMDKGGLLSKGGITDLYDGVDHYIQAGSGASAGKMRINATKDANGLVTAFKLYTCFQGTTQDNYVSMSNSSGVLTITAVGAHSFGTGGVGGTGGHRSTVTGGVDASGHWTDKTVTHDGSFAGTQGGTGFKMGQHLSATQTADDLTIHGYRSGSKGIVTQTQQLYAKAQLITSSSIDTLSLGDGSAKFLFNYNGSPINGVVSWTGDDGKVASTSPYATDVTSQTLDTVGTPNTAFGTGETWDCTAAAGTSFVQPNFGSLVKGDREKCEKLDIASGDGGGGDIDCSVGNN
jgi:hypothetical protein